MLKNYKILVLIIILTACGIIGILSVWIGNSYINHKEYLVFKAEQSLMGVLQDYYNNHERQVDRQRSNYQKNLVNDIKRKYPNIESDTIYALMDKNAQKRRELTRSRIGDRSSAPSERMSRSRSREILPWFLFNRDAPISTNDLDSIEFLLTEELVSRRINGIKIDLELIKIEHSNTNSKKDNNLKHSLKSQTRPILIDTDEGIFLVAKFSNLWTYILSKMTLQILFSIVLLIAFLGTFITLLKTINRQNKLAVLRKSFVNNMTHELKTPISTVTAAIESIQRYGAKDDKERMFKYLDISKRELDHLTNIVERVLQFNGDENQGLLLQKTEFDLISLIHSAIEGIRISAPEETSIRFESSFDKVKINADESHLRNILSNLLDNALKYSLSPANIYVNVAESEEHVIITVEDQGIGIPKTYHKNIFDIFFRVPTGELYNVKGFGLGLAYVKQVVLQHNGSIHVESEEGKGSQFTIKLPKAL